MNHIDLLNLWEQAYVSYYNPQPGEPPAFTNVVRRIEKVVRTAGDSPENQIFVRKIGENWYVSNPSHSGLGIAEQLELVFYPKGTVKKPKPTWARAWKSGELELIDDRELVRTITGWVRGF